MKPIKIGIVGVGKIVRDQHLPALAGNDDDPEGEFAAAAEAFRNRTPAPFLAPPEEPVPPDGLAAAGFPFPASEARRMQQADGAKAPLVLDLGDGATMTLAWIPPGEFVIGSLKGAADERPRSLLASAVLAASIFHYEEHAIRHCKDYLQGRGIPVRP